jgi:outer membrane protein assembly factor BamD (BamD/ComL family)
MGTYAILHELGHIFSKMEIKNFYKTINAYVNGTNRVSKIKNEKVRFYKYRNLRLEKLADKYAYLIYKNFENQIIKFDKKLQKFCE